MAIRSILVLADETTAPGDAAAAIEALAERTGAQIALGYLVAPVIYPTTLETALAAELLTRIERDLETAAEGFESALRAALQPSRITVEWRRLRAAEDAVVHALYADLVVMPRGAEAAKLGSALDPAEIMMRSGRPVLVVPAGARLTATPGPVLVAWQPGRVAARAVTEALPLLRRAAAVTVAMVDPQPGPDGHGPVPGADIGAYLARHEVVVTAEPLPSDGRDVDEVLLRRARELGADLVVMGGYGHSRVLELVLGGTTRAMLAQRQVPVLMAH